MIISIFNNNPLLNSLSEREREILTLYLGLEGERLTKEEIGEKLGLNVMRMNQILNKIRRKAIK